MLAPSLDYVSIEAYSLPGECGGVAGCTSAMNAAVDQAKARIPPGKQIVLVGMAAAAVQPETHGAVLEEPGWVSAPLRADRDTRNDRGPIYECGKRTWHYSILSSAGTLPTQRCSRQRPATGRRLRAAGPDAAGPA